MWIWILFGTLSMANPENTKTQTEVSEQKKSEKKSDYAPEKDAKGETYVFGWMDYPEPSLKLRGGTTKGIPVTLSTEPSQAWKDLQAEGLSPKEQDRRAILALTGEYRISFDFLEVELYGPSTKPTAPYRSWATEKVYVLEDTDRQISLQHIIVMFIEKEDGETVGPMLVKHWRQDWQYEPSTALEFIGELHWETRKLSETERKGQWQQTVYQVDDSPRYAMRGVWEHNKSYSAWNGASAWRPLPRREYTSRSDYQTLIGTNRLTVHPLGWVHSQDNIKTVLSSPKTIDADNPALAREFGLNRYDRIDGFDFSEADTYWEKTSDYWSSVRSTWSTHLGQAPIVKVDQYCDEDRVYSKLFGLAGDILEGKKMSVKKQQKKIENIIECSVSVPE